MTNFLQKYTTEVKRTVSNALSSVKFLLIAYISIVVFAIIPISNYTAERLAIHVTGEQYIDYLQSIIANLDKNALKTVIQKRSQNIKEYKEIQEYLINARSSTKYVKYLYIIQFNESGLMVYLIDGLPSDDINFSPLGTVENTGLYPNDTPYYIPLKYYEGWGKLQVSVAPIYDNNEIIAWIAADIDAQLIYSLQKYISVNITIITSILLFFIVMTIYIVKYKFTKANTIITLFDESFKIIPDTDKSKSFLQKLVLFTTNLDNIFKLIHEKLEFYDNIVSQYRKELKTIENTLNAIQKTIDQELSIVSNFENSINEKLNAFENYLNNLANIFENILSLDRRLKSITSLPVENINEINDNVLTLKMKCNTMLQMIDSLIYSVNNELVTQNDNPTLKAILSVLNEIKTQYSNMVAEFSLQFDQITKFFNEFIFLSNELNSSIILNELIKSASNEQIMNISELTKHLSTFIDKLSSHLFEVKKQVILIRNTIFQMNNKINSIDIYKKEV